MTTSRLISSRCDAHPSHAGEESPELSRQSSQRWRDPNDVNPKYIASPPAKEGSATATTEAAHNATEMQTSASHDEAAPRAGRSMSAWLLETLGNLMSPTNMILTGAILMGTAVLLLLRETQQEAGAEGEEGVKMENNALFQSEGGQDEEDEGEEGEEGEEDGDKPAEGEEEEEEEQEEEEEHEEKEEEEQDAGQRSVARRRRK